MAYTKYKKRFSIFYGWYIVAAGTLLLATCFGISYSFSVYFPALQSEFSWNRAATSGVFSLYLVLVGFFSIACGRAIDRYGPKSVVLIMGVVTGISFILTARVHTLWQFYLSYSFLLAAGTGGMYIIIMSTASRWFNRKRATAMGILGTGASLGPVVMAPVSAWLVETYQWRAAYMLTGILAWILIIPGAMVLKKDPAEIGVGLDGDLYLPAGSSDEANKTTAFSIIEAIKSPSFSYLNFVWFWFSFCLYMVIAHLVPRAQDMGLDPIRAAGVMSILMAVSAASRVAGGMAADIVDKRKLLAVSITAMALSMVWLTSADQSWKIYLFAIFFGVVFGGGDTSLIAVVTDVFGTEKIGTMMGILMISWGLGSAAGPYLAGFVFDYTGSYGWAFIIACGGLLLSTFAVLRIKITNGRF